jgi:hypothetical protein
MRKFGHVPGIVLAAAAGIAFAWAATAVAQSLTTPADSGNPQIDYQGYERLVDRVRPEREARLVNLSAFMGIAAHPTALILDARSAEAFAEGHIEGAVNLPLPDFTAEALAAVIGDPDRPILIYCNNNFANHVRPVPLKLAPLALNIQTFVNLYGYGYRNVFELNEVVDFNEPRVRWVANAS